MEKRQKIRTSYLPVFEYGVEKYLLNHSCGYDRQITGGFNAKKMLKRLWGKQKQNSEIL
jgi:hypothetical protein